MMERLQLSPFFVCRSEYTETLLRLTVNMGNGLIGEQNSSFYSSHRREVIYDYE